MNAVKSRVKALRDWGLSTVYGWVIRVEGGTI